MKSRIQSFVHAFAGLQAALKTQPNLRIHVGATLLAIGFSIYFELKTFQWLFVLSAVALVWIAELLNTAIEGLCDLYSSDFNPKIKFIKDVAAGAVLIAAMYALGVACFIFIPKITQLWTSI